MSLPWLIPFVFASASAQSSGSTSVVAIDAGVLSVSQVARTWVSAGAVAVSARRATTNTALFGSGLFVGSSDSSTATQATVGAEFALPQWPYLRVEASGTGTYFGVLSSDRGSSRYGQVRPQMVRENVGVFGTFGAGIVNRDEVMRFHSLAWDVGVWTRYRSITGAISAGRSFTNDYPLMEASDFFLTRPARHYAVQDVQANLTAFFGRFELQASGAARAGLGATHGSAQSLLGAVTTNIGDRFALTINAGRQLAAPLSGAPTARVVGASLRVYAMGADAARLAARVRSPDNRSSKYATRIERHATGGATVVVRVKAPVGARVELTGSFNDWAVTTLPRSSDAFELRIELPTGSHRLAVRINGGAWKAPAGLARVKDDFGGESGIVIVSNPES